MSDEKKGAVPTGEELGEINWYAAGIEPCGMSRGWVIVTGSEGEDPTPRAFFLDEETANTCAALRVPCGEGDTEPLFFDPSVELAVVCGGEIFASNDYTIDTHEKLEAALSSTIAAFRKGAE